MDYNDPTSHSPAGSPPAPPAAQARRPSVRRFLPKKKGEWIMGAGLTCAVVGLTGGVAAAATLSPSASSPSATATSSPTPTPTQPGPRSGPAAGGATGIIDTTSTSGFTISTATGVDVTVDETSATKIHGAPASAVKKGASVLVLGTVNTTTFTTTTITAAQVDVQRKGDGGAAAAKKSGVIPAQQGTPSPVKSVGQIPSDYTEGEGTIVSGTTANKATTAAQAVFPGGIVDRVVQLSDGEYEVHNIAINWPHHVFVSKNFKVLGAE